MHGNVIWTYKRICQLLAHGECHFFRINGSLHLGVFEQHLDLLTNFTLHTCLFHPYQAPQSRALCYTSPL